MRTAAPVCAARAGARGLFVDWPLAAEPATEAGLCARRRSSFLCFAKERNQRKATPLSASLRCAAGNLRCSRPGCAAELTALLRRFVQATTASQMTRRAHAALRPLTPAAVRLGAARRGEAGAIRVVAALDLAQPLREGRDDVCAVEAFGRPKCCNAPTPVRQKLLSRIDPRGIAARHRDLKICRPRAGGNPVPLRQMTDRPWVPACAGMTASSFTLSPGLSARVGAERSDGPYGFHGPSARAEKRRAWGGRGRHSTPVFRALTRCGCLSGVSTANKASSAAPPRDRASQAARSAAKGHGQQGRFLLPSFLGDARKEGRPPERNPGMRALRCKAAMRAGCCCLPLTTIAGELGIGTAPPGARPGLGCNRSAWPVTARSAAAVACLPAEALDLSRSAAARETSR